MTKPSTDTTSTGRKLTNAYLDAMADEVEGAEYGVEALKTRRRGRPLLAFAWYLPAPSGGGFRVHVS